MVGVKRVSIVISTVLAITLASTLVARAQGPFRAHADLSGYEENLTLSTPATGTLDLDISRDGSSAEYTLSYEGLATNVLFAHIHLGKPAINGGIMVFLCTNGTPPAGAPVPPPCPQVAGTVTGVLTAADVIGPGGQGVAAGEFSEFIQALRAEAAYGNVHTSAFMGGEIRGQIVFNRGNGK